MRTVTRWLRKTKLSRAIFSIIWITGLTLFLALTPLASLEQGRSLCLIKNISGHNCPGCGITRAIAAILKGKFTVAFSYNPLIIVVFPLLAWVILRELANSVYTIWCWAADKRKSRKVDIDRPCPGSEIS